MGANIAYRFKPLQSNYRLPHDWATFSTRSSTVLWIYQARQSNIIRIMHYDTEYRNSYGRTSSYRSGEEHYYRTPWSEAASQASFVLRYRYLRTSQPGFQEIFVVRIKLRYTNLLLASDRRPGTSGRPSRSAAQKPWAFNHQSSIITDPIHNHLTSAGCSSHPYHCNNWRVKLWHFLMGNSTVPARGLPATTRM